MTDTRVYRERTTLRTIVISLVALILGVLLLWVSENVGSSPVVTSLVRDLGSLLVATICIAVLWELGAKRSFIAEVLEATHLSSQLQTAGVIGVQSQWYDDVAWKSMLAAADHVDIFQAYGVAWRSVMADELARFAAREGSSCRVILPDPDDPHVMAAMASNFSRGEEEVRHRVLSAKKEFIERLSEPGKKVKYAIWYSSRPPLYSFVVMGDVAVVTMYKHHSGQAEVIGLVVRRGGHFFRFLENELAAFVNESNGYARLIAGSDM